jgi:hypothetical protein
VVINAQARPLILARPLKHQVTTLLLLVSLLSNALTVIIVLLVQSVPDLAPLDIIVQLEPKTIEIIPVPRVNTVKLLS